LDKAGKTIIKDSLQEKSILANNKSIATWVSDPSNKGKILDESKVSEILATKPKVEITPESSLAPEFPNPEPLPQDIPSGPPPIPDGEIVLAGGIAMAGAATLNSVDQYRKKRDEEQIRRDIAIAEGRLAELEEKEARNPGLRSLADDSKNIQDLQNTNRFSHAIVEAFEKTIDRIYGKKGVIGWGKVNGIKTKEWLEMDRFTAKEPVQYIKGESERGKLSQKFLKIAESPKNQKFIKELGDLMNQTEWKVEPREREKPSEFVMRLVEFITNKRSQLPNLKRAA
jgi:hypothetical protein